MESEDVVGPIHFFEVVSQQYATGEIRAGDARTGVSEREEMVRKVAVRPDAGQSVRSTGIIRRPAERRLQAGDIRIQSRELVHQLTGPLDDDLVAQARSGRFGIGAGDEQPILADPAN